MNVAARENTTDATMQAGDESRSVRRLGRRRHDGLEVIQRQNALVRDLEAGFLEILNAAVSLARVHFEELRELLRLPRKSGSVRSVRALAHQRSDTMAKLH
jgi:hypothetical protein